MSFSFIRFKQWGFERGWGDTAGRVKDTMRTLSEVLQAPDPINMEKFFTRVPTIFNVVIFSIHGYFGQADVLGLPDTGGQVTFLNSSSMFGYSRVEFIMPPESILT
jgi:sucrose synthase